MGVLSAERNQRPFVSEDLDRLAPLATQARLALDNLQLFGHLVASDRLAALGNLAASLAHEIRSPLTYGLENTLFLAQNLEALHRQKRDQLTPPPEEPLRLYRELSESRELNRFSRLWAFRPSREEIAPTTLRNLIPCTCRHLTLSRSHCFTTPFFLMKPLTGPALRTV